MDIFIDLINWLMDGFADTISWLVDLLPKSPISEFTNSKPNLVVLGHITWFIPFPTMLVHFTAILTAIGAYYIYRVIGRWLKMVRS